MAVGINTTGTPNTNSYNVGRGKVYFASLTASDEPKDWRDLGNATEFNLSVETETLEHTSSRGGLKVTDKEVTTSQKLSVSITLDELEFDNLRLFFSGTAHNDETNPAVAGVGSNGSEVTIAASIVLGRWYDLRTAAGVRLYDIAKANLTVAESNDGFTTKTDLTEGTDYTVDEKMGRVFLLSTGGATAGDALGFYIAADAGAVAVDMVKGLKSTAVTGAIKFIAENPANSDAQMEYQIHKVNLKPEGDFSLIGDDWTVMQLTGAAEASSWSAVADSPTLSIATHANA